jgi:hypothetical protein
MCKDYRELLGIPVFRPQWGRAEMSRCDNACHQVTYRSQRVGGAASLFLDTLAPLNSVIADI